MSGGVAEGAGINRIHPGHKAREHPRELRGHPVARSADGRIAAEADVDRGFGSLKPALGRTPEVRSKPTVRQQTSSARSRQLEPIQPPDSGLVRRKDFPRATVPGEREPGVRGTANQTSEGTGTVKSSEQ